MSEGYPQTLNYYMWGFQVYFRISCETRAESLFQQLDRGLRPDILLIGIRSPKIEQGHLVCIDPPDMPYKSTEFENLIEKGRESYRGSEDSQMIYTGPGQQEQMQDRHLRNHLRLALEKVINNSENNQGNVAFATQPVLVGNYFVFMVLQLNRSVYEAQFKLKSLVREDRLHFHRSLVEAAVQGFLKDRQNQLYLPDPGKGLVENERSSEELLKDAARAFFYTISQAGENFHGLHGLFGACEELSKLKYEGKENKGLLIVGAKKHKALSPVFQLKTAFEIRQYRRVRKLLEQTTVETGLHTDSSEVIGLVKVHDIYDATSQSVFSIRFTGVHCWQVEHNGEVLLHMHYGLPQLPTEAIDQDRFRNIAKRIFPGIDQLRIDSLLELSTQAVQLQKGAMLIITDHAASEAERFEKQCFGIDPVPLKGNLLESLCNVDGGVLLDTHGTVYAHGVILDGTAGDFGDPARGSRYNSAITYYRSKRDIQPTLIVVISDDGMVDIIPMLRPRIKASSLVQAIKVLKNMAENESTEIPFKDFNNLMRWLKQREFYLSETQCQQINTLRDRIDERLEKEHYGMRIIHEDLSPNTEMTPEYFKPEVETINKRR